MRAIFLCQESDKIFRVFTDEAICRLRSKKYRRT